MMEPIVSQMQVTEVIVKDGSGGFTVYFYRQNGELLFKASYNRTGHVTSEKAGILYKLLNPTKQENK